MSETNKMLSVEECQAILHRWQTEGLNDKERKEYTTKASPLLTDPVETSQLEEDIRESARKAKQIDDGFQETLLYLRQRWEYSPAWKQPYQDWVWLKFRWRVLVYMSCELATETSDVLHSFDTIYLKQIENIQTEQDRLLTINALESLLIDLDEKDRSAEMSRYFLDLSRDVAAFAYPRSEIIELTNDVEVLDAQIKAVQTVIGGQGEKISKRSEVSIAHSASDFVASLQAIHHKQAEALKAFYQTVTSINKMLASRVQLSSQAISVANMNSNYWPDGLLDFAEIWSAVRSQNVQFSGHIKGGLSAATDYRFRLEVKVAREVCTPLRAALMAYKEELQGLLDS